MAGKQNFVFEKGVPFSKTLIWRDKAKRPINLTGYGAVLEIRASATDPAVLLTLSTENGKIVLGGASGSIRLNVSEQEVASLPQTSVYKLAVIPSSAPKKYLLEGKITVSQWG